MLKLVKLDNDLSTKSFILQGLGNVGYHLSKFLTEDDGVKLIGISEFNGGIYNEDGINVAHAKKYFTKHNSFENYPKASFIKDSSLLLKRKCDILIPAARENVITEKNAEDISANLIGLIVVLDKFKLIFFDLTPKVPTEATFLLFNFNI